MSNSRTHITVARGPVAFVVLGVIVLGMAAFWGFVAPFVLSAVSAAGPGPGGLDARTLGLLVRGVTVLLVVGGLASVVRGIVGIVRRESPGTSSANFYVDVGVEPWLLDGILGRDERGTPDGGTSDGGTSDADGPDNREEPRSQGPDVAPPLF